MHAAPFECASGSRRRPSGMEGVVPLQKPNKPTETPKSYRPISLTPCLWKVIERIITRRIN